MNILARKIAARRMPAPLADDAALAFAPEEAALPKHVQDPIERAWRMALARTAREGLRLTLGFESVLDSHASLAEVLETPMDRALIFMLEGPEDALGLMVISPPIMAGMIEMLTLSRLSPPEEGEEPRKPTRTDAAMLVDWADAALAGFETALIAAGADVAAAWAAGYRYAAFIQDPRPLHLMLDDQPFRVLRSDLLLEDGARRGMVMLALPRLEAEVALPSPDWMLDEADASLRAAQEFQAEFATQVAGSTVAMEAILARLTLPLAEVLGLAEGMVLRLPSAALDQIILTAPNGLPLSPSKLGQYRGMRALRLGPLVGQGQIGLGQMGQGQMGQALYAEPAPFAAPQGTDLPQINDDPPPEGGTEIAGPETFGLDFPAVDFSQTG